MKYPTFARPSFNHSKMFEFSEEFVTNMISPEENSEHDSILDDTFLPFNNTTVKILNTVNNVKNIIPEQIGIGKPRFSTMMLPASKFIALITDNPYVIHMEQEANRNISQMIEEFKNLLLRIRLAWKVKWNQITNMQVIIQGLTGYYSSDTKHIDRIDMEKYNGSPFDDINGNIPQYKACLIHPSKPIYQDLNFDESYTMTLLMDITRSTLYMFKLLHEPKRKLFVVRVRKKVKVGNKNPKIKPDRDNYIYLNPMEFAGLSETHSGIIHFPTDDVPERASHFRRAHYRTLRHERYGDNIGKQIYIKPIWVGSNTTNIKNKQYKVILGIENNEDNE